jgi:ATP-dependent Clp protease ATP-binding subunit ClpA
LLFGKLVHGGEVKVRIKDNQPTFEIVSAPPKAVKPKGTKGKLKNAAKPAADAPPLESEPAASGDGSE